MNNFFSHLIKFKFFYIPVFAIVLYIQSVSFGIVHFDDYVILNQVLKDSNGFKDIFASFSHGYGAFYRPLQTAIFIINNAIGNGSPWIFHLTNVILHSLVCCFLFIFLKKIGYKDITCLIWGLIFAAHPLFIHTVVWFPSLGDILVTLFGLISFIFFIDFANKQDWKSLSLCLLFYIIALFSKETAVILPLLFIIWFLLTKKAKVNFDVKKISLIAGLTVLTLIWYLLRNNAVQSLPPDEVLGVIPFIKNLRIIPELIGKFIIPAKLMTVPTYSIINTLLGILVIAGLIILAFINKNRRTKLIIFGFLWFLLLMIPVMIFNLNYASDYFDYLDHRAYLPIIGIIIILNEIIPKNIIELKTKLSQYIFLIIICIFSITTVVHSQNYKNGERFWKNAIKNSPKRAWYRYHLGRVYRIENKNDLAEKQYIKSISLSRSYAQFFDGLAEIYFEQNRIDEAIALLRECIKITNSSPESFNNLAALLNHRGYTDEAIDVINSSLSKWKDNYRGYNQLVTAYSTKRKFDKANLYANKIIELGIASQQVYQFYLNWADDLYKHGDVLKAIELLNNAIKINPRYPIAYNIMGNYYLNAGEPQKAEEIWLRGISIVPDYPEFYGNLYKYYNFIAKKPDEARRYAEIYKSKGGVISENY